MTEGIAVVGIIGITMTEDIAVVGNIGIAMTEDIAIVGNIGITMTEDTAIPIRSQLLLSGIGWLIAISDPSVIDTDATVAMNNGLADVAVGGNE